MIPRFTTFKADNPYNKGQQTPLLAHSSGVYCRFEDAQDAVKEYFKTRNENKLNEAFGLIPMVGETNE